METSPCLFFKKTNLIKVVSKIQDMLCVLVQLFFIIFPAQVHLTIDIENR